MSVLASYAKTGDQKALPYELLYCSSILLISEWLHKPFELIASSRVVLLILDYGFDYFETMSTARTGIGAVDRIPSQIRF